MSGKQSTLFKYGFTKKIHHRNNLADVSGEDFVSGSSEIYKCNSCDNSFKSRQGLSMHVIWAHPTSNNANKSEAALKVVNSHIELAVKRTLDDLVSTVATEIASVNNPASNTDVSPPPEAVKVRKRRKQYDFVFKMEIIEQVESGISPIDVAFNNNIDKSLVARWLQNKRQIIDGASSQHRKLFSKNRKSTKHQRLFKKLYSKFKDARSKGMKVSFSWLYTKANIINKELNPNSARVPKSIVASFNRKYNIKLRKVQRKKRVDKTNFGPKMMKWHCTLREGLIKSGCSRPEYDQKWGRFPPSQRLNVDQIPLPFAINRTTTYEDDIPKENRKDHKVWVANPGSGLEKRQCPLQLAFSPVHDSIKLAIIFRGKGKRISEDEINAYHKSIDVYWQENAWADTKVCVDWARKTLAPAMKGSGDYILFCDNLVGQTAASFQEEVRKSGGIVWYEVKDATDIWQPVDAGMGQILKVLTFHEQQDWLEFDDNLDIWM